MTRKDYEATAAAFAANNTPAVQGNPTAASLWLELRDCMADMFALDNPRFDRDKFYFACYGKGEGSSPTV